MDLLTTKMELRHLFEVKFWRVYTKKSVVSRIVLGVPRRGLLSFFLKAPLRLTTQLFFQLGCSHLCWRRGNVSSPQRSERCWPWHQPDSFLKGPKNHGRMLYDVFHQMFDHFIIVSLLSPIRLIHRFMEGGVSGQGFLHRLDVPSSGLSLGDFCDAKSAQMIQICNRI